jgi:hypothetical protein
MRLNPLTHGSLTPWRAGFSYDVANRWKPIVRLPSNFNRVDLVVAQGNAKDLFDWSKEGG